MKKVVFTLVMLLSVFLSMGQEKPRIIIETDIGGDADDQASFVRYLFYCNEFDTRGIILTMGDAQFNSSQDQTDIDQIISGDPVKFNQNPSNASNSYEMTMDYIDAYESIIGNLNKHVPSNRKFPSVSSLKNVVKKGYKPNSTSSPSQDGERLIINELKKNDSRPIWYLNWGTIDTDKLPPSLTRVLTKIKKGQVSGLNYDEVVKKIRYVEYSDHDHLNDKHNNIDHQPRISYYLDTFLPRLRQRWADRWRALTQYQKCDSPTECHIDKACTNDLCDLYTTPKEGDTGSFMHLLPVGINIKDHPEFGGWSGRYGFNTNLNGWQCSSGQTDNWLGTTSRDNTLIRWGGSASNKKAVDITNDFRVRAQWGDKSSYSQSNHPPIVNINGKEGFAPTEYIEAKAGSKIPLDASASSDPDNNSLRYEWVVYNEISEKGATLSHKTGSKTTVSIPNDFRDGKDKFIHVYLRVVDNGAIPLARYRRVVFVTSEFNDPTVQITSPRNNAYLTTNHIDAPVVVKTEVFGDGVDRVEFFVNGTKSSEDATNPYTDATIRRSEKGEYRVRARLWFDDNTNSIWSNTVNFTIGDGILGNVIANSQNRYERAEDFSKESLVYTDRNYKVVTFPSQLTGSEYIKTSNSDKQLTTNNLLKFDLGTRADVYVAYDVLLSNKPSWLSSFAYTGQNVTTDNGGNMRLYKKRYNAGTVTLGGNSSPNNASSSYFVIVKSIPAGMQITQPTNNQNVRAKTNIPIRVNAEAGSRGSITEVQFFNNNTLLGKDTTAPYTFDIKNIAAGTHKISATLLYKEDGTNKTLKSKVITIKATNLLINYVTTKSDKKYEAKQNFGRVVPYTDKNTTITVFPTDFSLHGAEYIKTADRDKRSTRGDILTMNLTTAADVFVAYDRRLPRIPNWLRSYTDTREHVRTNHSVIMRLYKKRFPKGNVVFGGCESRQDNSSNYFVIVKEAPASIRISSPLNNTSVQTGTNVKVTAVANAGSGKIKSVIFYHNDIKVATDTQSPFSYTIPKIKAGDHKVKAHLHYDDFNDEHQYKVSSTSNITASSLLISSISTKSDKVYRKMNGFGRIVPYTDKNTTLTVFPTAFNLHGSEYIMTADRDKRSTRGDILTMNLSATADVYVAYDRRLPRIPHWLRSYTDTREHVRTNHGVIMRLYKKRFPKGRVVFGGCESRQDDSSNYFVIVRNPNGSARLSETISNDGFIKPEETIGTLYPNPFTGIININSDVNQDWEVYDNLGKRINVGHGTLIDLSLLGKGHYFVKVNNKVHKVVKLK